MAAPKGNQNAKKAKVWSDAIRKALAGDKGRLERLARALLDKAEEGDMAALREVGDRLEGKPVQSHEVGGDEDNPLSLSIKVTYQSPDGD